MNIIAEIAGAADGSLGTAHAYIDAVARTGANTIKFQCHVGDPCDQFRPGTDFPQDATRQDYWNRTSFTTPQWRSLAAHAHDAGLKFCVSVFSKAGISHLEDVGVDLWKIGSAQVSNLPLVSALAGRWEPLIISSGMSDWAELDRAVEVAVEIERKNPAQLRPSPRVMQCTSAYPCPPERIGVNLIAEMRQRYPGVPVGLSCHSGTIWPSIVAASQGADMVEVHVCFSRDCFGPDVPASVTIDELKQLVEGVKFVEKMKPVDKSKVSSQVLSLKEVFR